MMSFILLKDIAINTKIYFTENGWDDDADNGGATPTWGNIDEGTLTWTSTSPLSCGTQVQIIEPLGTLSASTGSITESNNWSLSTSGDSIIAYQGTGIPTTIGSIPSEVTTFLWAFAIDNDFTSNVSSDRTDTGIPPGLIDGATAIGFLDGANDNYQYDCTKGIGNVNTLRTLLATESSFLSVPTIVNYQAPTCTFYCTTIDWTGGTTDWATATNWNPAAVPTASDDVSIPVVSTNYPTASSAVTVNAVTIESGATLIAESTFAGNITYQRNLGTTNWYLLSSPVSGETIQNLITNHTFATGTPPNIGLAPYDNSQPVATVWDYQELGSMGSINNGQGYAVKLAAAGDVSFSGTLNTSDVLIALTQGSGGGGDDFNLLGNPFTAFIDSGTFLENNTSDLTSETIWLWNQSSDTYDTKVTTDAFRIAPGQGFFVQANSTNNVTFAEAIQEHKTLDTFQRTSRPEVHLFLNDDENNARYSKIYYINGTTTSFDNGYDGELFGGVQNSFELYSHLLTDNQNKKYQIQSLPNSDYESMVIPIGIKADAGKEITFSAETLNLPTDLKVFLEDKEANIFTRLDEANAEYTVTLSEALDGVGRFYLHTSASALTVEDATLNTIHVYKSDNSTLRIVGLPQGNTTVKLYNVLGKQIISTSFDDTVKDILLPKLATGVYIVKIETEIGKLNQKIVLE